MKELATPYSRPAGEEAVGKACYSTFVTVRVGDTGDTGRGILTERRNALSNQFGVCLVTEGCSGKVGQSFQEVMETV